MQRSFASSFVICRLSFMFLLVTSVARSQTVDAYLIPDFGAGNIQIFSVATNQLLATVQTGASPTTGAISLDGRLAYVPNLNSNYLSVLDLTIGAEITRIHGLFDSGVGVNIAAITADGTQVVVPAAAGVLAVINTADFSVTRVSLPPICDDAVPARCDTDPNDLHIISLAVTGQKVYLNLATSFPVRVVCVDLNNLTVSTIPGTAVGTNFFVNSMRLFAVLNEIHSFALTSFLANSPFASSSGPS